MKPKIFLGYAAACLCVLRLQAADTIPPAVLNITPPPGATVSNLTQVIVLFNEPVVSVLSWNLQINGIDADAVVGTGASNFTFSFTQPLPGAITIPGNPPKTSLILPAIPLLAAAIGNTLSWIPFHPPCSRPLLHQDLPCLA